MKIIVLVNMFYRYYSKENTYTSNSNLRAKFRDKQVVCYPFQQRYYHHELIQSLWTSPESTF